MIEVIWKYWDSKWNKWSLDVTSVNSFFQTLRISLNTTYFINTFKTKAYSKNDDFSYNSTEICKYDTQNPKNCLHRHQRNGRPPLCATSKIFRKRFKVIQHYSFQSISQTVLKL